MRIVSADRMEYYHDDCAKTSEYTRLGFETAIEVVKSLPSIQPKPKTGRWIRMSDLSEQEDDRYQCSYCGNVVHHKNKMNLYTFNSWCGRCGSNNGRN